MTAPAEMHTAALFTATDRCDRCSGRATVLVVLQDGGNLAFCDHHLRRHRAALVPIARRFERHVELDEALTFVPAMPTRGARERRVRGTGVDR
jgi:hypothetical protein